MNHSIFKHRTLSLALAFTGFVLATNLALAEEDTEVIIVSAPIERMETKATETATMKTETIELNRYVSANDLDLSKSADVSELDARIDTVAKESCKKLRTMFPLDESDPAESARCVRKAIASAQELKNKAVAAAQSENP